MKKIAGLLSGLMFVCGNVFAADSGVIDIAFDKMKFSGAVSLDKGVAVSSTPSLKLECKSEKHHPKAEIEFTLDKDVSKAE